MPCSRRSRRASGRSNGTSAHPCSSAAPAGSRSPRPAGRCCPRRAGRSTAAGGTDGLLAALRARELDVAFVAVQTADVPDLHLDPIAEFQPRLLVPAGHPLAGRTTVSPAALAGEPFIDLPPGFCNRIRTDNDFRRAGISRTIAVEVSDITTIPGYVESGIGVALVPPLAAEDGCQVVPIGLDPPAASWTLAAASLGGPVPSPAVRAFLNLVDAHVVRRDRY